MESSVKAEVYSFILKKGRKMDREKVVLVFCYPKNQSGKRKARERELKTLVQSAGGMVEATVSQEVEAMDPSTLIGSGKVKEIASLVQANGWDTVIFEQSLTGSQRKNLQDQIDAKVIDRVDLLLDIFADRARTKKAKLDIHLAQLEYRLPRLRGYGEDLSRTGGGIGTRGPGEQKLETDRREIVRQMKSIRHQRKKISGKEKVIAEKRRRSEICLIALAGYTNVGKSTILNGLIRDYGKEGKEVYADDRLFATLDIHMRRIQKEGEPPLILADTIGFIHQLPEKLERAFESTLEEIGAADRIALIADASNPDYDEEIKVVHEMIKEKAKGIPILYVMNKWDLAQVHLNTPPGETLCINAHDPNDRERLYERLLRDAYGEKERCDLLIPYDQLGTAQKARDFSQILKEEGNPEGMVWTLDIRPKALAIFLRHHPQIKTR